MEHKWCAVNAVQNVNANGRHRRQYADELREYKKCVAALNSIFQIQCIQCGVRHHIDACHASLPNHDCQFSSSFSLFFFVHASGGERITHHDSKRL